MWIMRTLLKWKPLASYPSALIAQIIFCQLFRRPLNLILAEHDIWNNPWSWRSHPKPMRVSETCALVKLLQLGGHQLSGELGRSGYKDRPSANNHHRKMLLNSPENTILKMLSIYCHFKIKNDTNTSLVDSLLGYNLFVLRFKGYLIWS